MTPTATTPGTTATPGSVRHEAAMFWLSVGFLLLTAGLIHRAVTPTVSAVELWAMYFGMVGLWPIFIVEAVIGVLRRAPGYRFWPAVGRAVLIVLIPPYRIGRPHPRTRQIWFPRLGWVAPGKETYDRIDRAFGTPMLFVAILILPILVLEYTQSELVKSSHGFSLALDISVAIIWVAFALEFLLESSAAPKTGKYLKEKWLDAAIVIIPMLEFVMTRLVDAAPLARLLRLGRALSPEQLARMQRLYRLRGLTTKAWSAFLLIGGMRRIFGQSPEKRLKVIQDRVEELQLELTALEKEAAELRVKIAEEEAKSMAAAPQPESR